MKDFIAALGLSLATLIGGFLLMALAFSKTASAEELPQEPLPTEFYMDYTPDVQLVLESDQCDKSDLSRGWSAYAIELSTKRKAEGCWQYTQEETVTIHISIGVDPETGGEKFLDYRLFKSKFTPRYN